MKRVIYWFIFLFSIQVVGIVAFEIAGGSYNIYDPPSFKILAGFGIVSSVLLIYSSYKIFYLYRRRENE